MIAGIAMIRKIFKRKRKAEKRARKAKKALYVFGLCCAFCAGASVASVLIYRNRKKLAVMALGKRNIKLRRLKKS